MSTLRLTRVKRWLMQKQADHADRVTQADLLFFQRFPHQQHRVRHTSREHDELVTASGRQPTTTIVRIQHASTNVRRDHLYENGRPGSQ